MVRYRRRREIRKVCISYIPDEDGFPIKFIVDYYDKDGDWLGGIETEHIDLAFQIAKERLGSEIIEEVSK